MRFYVKAYSLVDGQPVQILGNLDGQRSWQGKCFWRAKWYKRLSRFPTLNNRVAFYVIVDEQGNTLERIEHD